VWARGPSRVTHAALSLLLSSFVKKVVSEDTISFPHTQSVKSVTHSTHTHTHSSMPTTQLREFWLVLLYVVGSAWRVGKYWWFRVGGVFCQFRMNIRALHSLISDFRFMLCLTVCVPVYLPPSLLTVYHSHRHSHCVKPVLVPVFMCVCVCVCVVFTISLLTISSLLGCLVCALLSVCRVSVAQTS
jgi:hypothetical protein